MMFGNYPGIAVLQGGEDVNETQRLGITPVLKTNTINIQ